MRRLLAILLSLVLTGQSWATDYYLRSTDGDNVDDGLSWANAKATLANALGTASAGDRIFVSDNHAETQASAMTLTSLGTAASPCQIICVDDAGNPQPPTTRATTATVSTTGNSSIVCTGFTWVYGVTFQCADSTNGPNLDITNWNLDNCTLYRRGTSASGGVRALAGDMRWKDTSVRVDAAGVGLLVTTKLVWVGGTATKGTGATTLFGGTNSNTGLSRLIGVDCSQYGSGTTILPALNSGKRIVELINCKLGSSVTLMGTPTTPAAEEIEVINCDSGNTNYRYQKQSYAGTITQETTIVRSGGATDGTTPISHKFVSSANSKFYAPLRGPWLTFWNETTGSAVAVTAETVTDNVTLTDAEAWIEVEYLGTSGFPLSVIATDQVSDPVFGTPANQTTSTVTWTTTGLTTPVKQKLSTSVTPQVKGPIRARVVLAKPSTTMYTCPKVRP